MTWTAIEKAFLLELEPTTTEDEIFKVVNNYHSGKNKPAELFHKYIISLFQIPAHDDDILKALPLIYSKYRILYKNLRTLSVKLSEVRMQSIKPYQTANIYSLSKRSKYFNLSEEERNEIKTNYQNKIKNNNNDRVQVDINEIIKQMRILINSDNVYDKLIALMIATGARAVEMFDKNTFELIPNKPAWLKVSNLAKKRVGGKDWNERPIVLFTPIFVINAVNKIRKQFKNKGAVIINNRGELSKDKQQQLNLHVVKALPWLSEYKNKSSMLRKIYSDMSYKIYADPKTCNFNTWTADVLGHGGLMSSFSYSYINVCSPEDIELKTLRADLIEIREKVNLLTDSKETKEPDPPKYNPVPRNATTAEKLQLLELIYSENPNITNRKLREYSRMGSGIVNSFIKTKQAEPPAP